MRVRITRIERLNNSVNGNPRYEFGFEDAEGDYHRMLSSSDASFVYEIGNVGYRVGSPVDITLTRAGRVATMKWASE